jgi:hypothetical protein
MARYPDYYPEYRAFLKEDPLAAARAALDGALGQSGSGWLASARNLIGGNTEFARALPRALPAACTRIAVWHHRLGAPFADKILALARLIASADGGAASLRLLLIGEASEALWHTGVVDVMPSSTWQETTLLTDAALVGLAGCRVLLAEDLDAAPIGIDHVLIDSDFEPGAWLRAWRQPQQAHPLLEGV